MIFLLFYPITSKHPSDNCLLFWNEAFFNWYSIFVCESADSFGVVWLLTWDLNNCFKEKAFCQKLLEMWDCTKLPSSASVCVITCFQGRNKKTKCTWISHCYWQWNLTSLEADSVSPIHWKQIKICLWIV